MFHNKVRYKLFKCTTGPAMKHGSVYFGGLSRGDTPPKEIPTLGAAGGRPKLSEMTMIPSTLRRQEGNDKPAMTGNDLSYCIKRLMTGGWFNELMIVLPTLGFGIFILEFEFRSHAKLFVLEYMYHVSPCVL